MTKPALPNDGWPDITPESVQAHVLDRSFFELMNYYGQSKGEKAKAGTRILDSSDIMGLLGYPKVPLILNESHLRDGLTNHPEMTASAWKTSAGAAARIPVALAANLNNTLKEFKKRGLFVVGLDGDGDISLPNFDLGTEPVILVIGSEGKGLSRLVQENCDAILSIPITSHTESLNAGIAASVALYEVSRRRGTN